MDANARIVIARAAPRPDSICFSSSLYFPPPDFHTTQSWRILSSFLLPSNTPPLPPNAPPPSSGPGQRDGNYSDEADVTTRLSPPPPASSPPYPPQVKWRQRGRGLLCRFSFSSSPTFHRSSLLHIPHGIFSDPPSFFFFFPPPLNSEPVRRLSRVFPSRLDGGDLERLLAQVCTSRDILSKINQI